MANDKVQVAGAAGSRGLYVDGVKVVGARTAFVADDFAQITDSTTGTSTGSVCNDSTASVKDDLAVIIRKVNNILTLLKAHGMLASS